MKTRLVRIGNSRGPRRGDVYLVQLNPARASEIRRTRPLVLDQVRTVDQQRLMKRLGALTEPTLRKMLGVLQ